MRNSQLRYLPSASIPIIDIEVRRTCAASKANQPQNASRVDNPPSVAIRSWLLLEELRTSVFATQVYAAEIHLAGVELLVHIRPNVVIRPTWHHLYKT